MLDPFRMDCGALPRLLVHTAGDTPPGRDLRQQRVRLALFVERLLEQLFRVAEPEVAGEGACRPVRRDLVVLDALCSRDERRVLRGRVAAALDDLLALFDEGLHALALP